MKKVNSGIIKLKDIKHVENSRIRGQDDVSDLMQDIEQRGLLQNIAVRIKDSALIYGNRRVKAFEKLGYNEISCDFFDDISDEDLLIINLAENLKRKNIGSIEIGRICAILQDKNMTNSEIATRLGISKSRVDSSVSAFRVTLNTPFANLVIFGNKGQHKGIPETLIWKIQNSLSRARRLSKDDWNQLLRALESGELTVEKISQLRKILISSPELDISKALDVLTKCRICHVWFHFDEKELNTSMKKEKCSTENEFIKLVMRNYNKNLLF